MNTYQIFEETVNRYRGRPAVRYLGETFHYIDIFAFVERLSTGFTALGLKRRDKIILYMPNTPQWIISWLAIQKIGGVVIPIAPIYTPRDLRYIAGDSGARTIICADTNFGYAKELKEEGTLDTVIVTGMADLLPRYKWLIGKAFDRIPEGRIEKGAGIYELADLMKTRTTMEGAPVSEDETLEMLYTGGTTKNPKGVPISHALFLESVKAQLDVSASVTPPPDNVVLQGGPLFHILGQVFGLGPLCITGDCVIIMPKVSIDAFLYYVQTYKAKTFFGVPALYRMILEHDRLDFYDISSLTYCFSGGDVLPQETARRWKERFGKRIYEGYGATETCGGVTMPTVMEEIPPGSIGKALSIKKVKIVDETTLEDMPVGEAGELLVSSDHMVGAYWNKEEETKEAFVEIDGRRWYRTGDVVRKDEHDFFYFVDRTADTIKHKGYRVSSSEIEAALQEHPAVLAVCAVGVPDEKVGERIKAFVVLKEDVKGVTGYDLIHWCRDHLASYKIPQYIEFRDMLPKSKVGKLLRREMRREERKRHEETE
ncbi:MAG: Long-chain-fatty-acid--CoA ligase [Syntrophorhabdus sp. PtaU1.Bin058]|nr:MAG: Long-chain-fatty-acid--CoA ligase [Syntrophorhabdus sp. PtaU1.Bin058]